LKKKLLKQISESSEEKTKWRGVKRVENGGDLREWRSGSEESGESGGVEEWKDNYHDNILSHDAFLLIFVYDYGETLLQLFQTLVRVAFFDL
jgi:hypothetical protein